MSQSFRESVRQFRQAFRMFVQAAPTEPLPTIEGIDGMTAIKLSGTVYVAPRTRWTAVRPCDPLEMRALLRDRGVKFDRYQFDYLQEFSQ